MKIFSNFDTDLYHRILIFAVSLIFALLLWLQTSSLETYEAEFSMPLILNNLSSEYLITNSLPENVTVKIRAQGKSLLKLYFLKKKKLRYAINLENMDPGSMKHSFEQKYINLPEQFTGSIISISPQILVIKIEKKHEKTVKVLADSVELLFKEGFTSVRELQIEPSEVTIYGPQENIKNIHHVQLKPITLSNLDKIVQKTVEVEKFPQYDYITVTPKKVTITQEVENLQQRKISNLPVKVINLPTGYKANVLPSNATVTFSGPVSFISKFKVGEISVIIDAKNLEPGKHWVRAEIDFPKDKVNLVEVKPRNFELNIIN